MDKASFLQLLQAQQQGDNNATLQIQKVEETNIVQLYACACQVIADPSIPISLRFGAVIYINGTVKAQSAQKQKLLNHRWMALSVEARHEIRGVLLRLLDEENQGMRLTAVSAVGCIAANEVPHNEWNDLIPQLLGAVKNPQTSLKIRRSSIHIIGELCKELSHECKNLSEHTDEILNSIACAVNDGDLDLKINGIEALNNALKFCSANFAKADECRVLMQMICQAATPTTPDPALFQKQFKLQAVAWDCLSGVVGYYYNILQPYIVDIHNCSIAVIRQALNPIEGEELKEATELASIQAIEFWYSLARNEEIFQKELEDAAENGEQDHITVTNSNYVQHALPHIVPLLLQCMCLQGEDADDSSYNITLSAMNCLIVFAQQCDEQFFSIVLPQVERSINSPDWRFRDAALTALGSALSSPAIADEKLNISTTLTQALGVVVQLTKDPNGFVATSAAWCVKQYCVYTPHLVLPQLQAVVETAIMPLLQQPRNRPTENICQAIYELSQCILEENLENQDAAGEIINAAAANQPNALQPYFQQMVHELLNLSQNATQPTLLINSYEALGSLIQCGAGDNNPNLPQLLQILGQRLETSTQQFDRTQQQAGTDIDSYKVHAQGLICAAMAHLIYHLPREYVLQQTPNLLTVFNTVLAVDPTISVEALSGIEAMVYILEKDFQPHVENTYGQLLSLIKHYAEVGSVVSRAFVVLCTALAHTQHCPQPVGDAIVQTIFAVLSVDTADQSGKTAAIDCFADLIEVCQDQFTRYFSPVCDSLFAAAEYSLTKRHDYVDIDLVEYLLTLQISLCKTLNAFVTFLGRDSAPVESYRALGQRMTQIITYAINVLQDTEATSTSRSVALNLLADSFPVLPDVAPQLIQAITKSEVDQVLRSVAKNTRGKVRTLAMETLTEFSQLKK